MDGRIAPMGCGMPGARMRAQIAGFGGSITSKQAGVRALPLRRQARWLVRWLACVLHAGAIAAIMTIHDGHGCHHGDVRCSQSMKNNNRR